MSKRVLDLFSAAAGGWSLGMHRAGFTTMAACEAIDWRRALYRENNPGVPVYDDVKTLTADRLVRNGHGLPDVVVGSPPCQDISSANTKGKGVEGERSGLFFEAVRIIGECRPRWFALENSSNLRVRGADAVLAALEAIGYACWTFVVRAGDIGANHERPRAWIIGCDLDQISRANRKGEFSSSLNEQMGKLRTLADSLGYPSEDGRRSRLPRRRAGAVAGSEQSSRRNDAHTVEERSERIARSDEQRQSEVSKRPDLSPRPEMGLCAGNRVDIAGWESDWSLDDLAGRVLLDARIQAWTFVAFLLDEGGQECLAERLIAEAKSAGFAAKLSLESDLQAALRTVLASYSGSTALRLAPIAETLSAECNITLAPENSWEAPAKSAEEKSGSLPTMSTKTGQTIPPKTSKRFARPAIQNTTSEQDLKAVHRRAEQRFKRSASRIVEAFGDAVVPQIPEAIGRAILRTERALAEVYGRAAA